MTTAVFLGTPREAVPSLHAVADAVSVRLVVTRPDRPRGRSGRPQAPPVKEAAESLGLPLAQPLDRAALRGALEGCGPVDVGVLVAFGMILEPEILAIPRRGFLNVHFSLLPRWRGPAPVPRAIGAGDRTTGVTIIEMDEGVDTGPILVSRSVEIGERETAGELAGRLSELGAELLRQVLVPYGEAAFEPVPQSEAGVTYAPRIEPSEARIALSDPAPRIERHVRAFNPRPGAYALVGSERLKIWRVEVAGEDGLEAGELRVRDRRLLLGTGEGALELVEVQPAGKPRMPGAAWARGRRGALGYLS